MHEIKTAKMCVLSEVLSPLTHMSGIAGNEAILNTSKVYVNGGVVSTPVISGNAIRHKMVREPGAMFLVEACGLYGKLNVDQANFLFYGGSLTDSAISDNLKKIADMQTLLPLIRLLGGSLTNQVIAGSLLVSQGVMVCRENNGRLQKMMPMELAEGLPALRSCEDFIGGYQYTRGDISKKPELLADDAELPEKSNLMIYAGQSVIPGALFYHEFILQKVSRLEVGAICAALNDWDGVIGGSARIGHGRLSTAVYCDGQNFFGDRLDLKSYEDEYREYTRRNASKIVDWLNDAFSLKAAKMKKAKKPDAGDDIDFFGEAGG